MTYKYNAELIKVIDGDTIKLKVDCGFRLTYTDNFRLARINAPEVRGDEREQGLKAKVFVINEFSQSRFCTVETIKHGKYRWVAEITLADGTNLSDRLVENGHAIYKSY